MSNSKKPYPNPTRPNTASACLAEHNTAAKALLDALAAQLRPCSRETTTWAEVGDAEDLVRVLLDAYAARQPETETGTLEITTEDGETLVFQAER